MTSGLITLYDYATSTTATSSTAGDVANYLKDTKVAQGETAAALEYLSRRGAALAGE